jgi:hypothetical protein
MSFYEIRKNLSSAANSLLQFTKKTIIGIKDPYRPNQNHLIIHCSYHKVGTFWFAKVLRAVAREFDLDFSSLNQGDSPQALHPRSILLYQHSQVDLESLPAFRGSHLIRDPRDVVVSGYHYHLWTKERWANTPIKFLPKFKEILPIKGIDDLTYQEYLNSLSREEGMRTEMLRATATVIKRMANWDYKNPYFLELKYEQVIQDERNAFLSLFRHYGFNDAAVTECVDIAMNYSITKTRNKRPNGKSHIRSGASSQWVKEFSSSLKEEFKELNGDVLIKLGYEDNNNW